jgi:hypothetical protein
MHAEIKVTDLSLRQWDYLQDNREHKHRFRAGEVRTCVEFELKPDMHSLHVELPIVDLAGLLTVLIAIEQAAQAEATLTDAEKIVGRVVEQDHSACNPRTCTVVEEVEELPDDLSYEEQYREEHEPTPYRRVQQATENRSDFPGWDAL